MSFPIKKPELPVPRQASFEEGPNSGDVTASGTTMVLVVDDEAGERAVLCATLEQQGHTVNLVSSGGEALRALEGGHYHLVLTEVDLRDMSGISLLDEIHERNPLLPVVMVSAVREISVAVDAMRRGACDYLVKPIDREQLQSTVARALEHSLTLTEHRDYKQSLEEMVGARTDMLRQALEDLENSYDVTLEALGDALDLKDSETEGHSRRVTGYTIALARAMGLSSVQIKVIARGAFLHDIGKMAIPDHILLKPGKLNTEERAIMREHCTRGYEILRKIPFLTGAAEIVFCHQEHFDGRGYPSGLKGNEIPIGARIFAVADALDAITSDRPYRNARSFEEARAEIKRCSGTQFDPEVVEVFLRLPSQLWQELKTEIGGQSERLSGLAPD